MRNSVVSATLFLCSLLFFVGNTSAADPVVTPLDMGRFALAGSRLEFLENASPSPRFLEPAVPSGSRIFRSMETRDISEFKKSVRSYTDIQEVRVRPDGQAVLFSAVERSSGRPAFFRLQWFPREKLSARETFDILYDIERRDLRNFPALWAIGAGISVWEFMAGLGETTEDSYALVQQRVFKRPLYRDYQPTSFVYEFTAYVRDILVPMTVMDLGSSLSTGRPLISSLVGAQFRVAVERTWNDLTDFHDPIRQGKIGVLFVPVAFGIARTIPGLVADFRVAGQTLNELALEWLGGDGTGMGGLIPVMVGARTVSARAAILLVSGEQAVAIPLARPASLVPAALFASSRPSDLTTKGSGKVRNPNFGIWDEAELDRAGRGLNTPRGADPARLVEKWLQNRLDKIKHGWRPQNQDEWDVLRRFASRARVDFPTQQRQLDRMVMELQNTLGDTPEVFRLRMAATTTEQKWAWAQEIMGKDPAALTTEDLSRLKSLHRSFGYYHEQYYAGEVRTFLRGQPGGYR